MKTFKHILILLIFGVIVFFVVNKKKDTPPVVDEIPKEEKDEIKPDVFNMTYRVDGEEFTLIEGKAEKTIEVELDGFTMTNSLIIIGEPLYADLDNDGDTDSAVWLFNNSGGTGRFIYGAFVINDNNQTFHSTEAMFLGDRIVVKNIEFKEGRAIYNFLERNFDEPMSAEPTSPRSIWVHYDKKNNTIGEWVKDFEGESR